MIGAGWLNLLERFEYGLHEVDFMRRNRNGQLPALDAVGVSIHAITDLALDALNLIVKQYRPLAHRSQSGADLLSVRIDVVVRHQ